MFNHVKIFIFLVGLSIGNIFAEQKKIVVLICSYNNQNYCEQNLLSLFNQDYQNWIAYYIDDYSTDNTFETAYHFSIKHNMIEKMIFVKNEHNLGSLANQHRIISQLADHDIVVFLDGDDFLYDQTVLSYVNEVYQDPNIWMTYGTYVPLRQPFPVSCQDVCDSSNIDALDFFRKSPWLFSHLRTFYAALFKKIKKEDLLYNGQFLKIVTDLPVALPMLEMCNGKIKHYKYLAKKLYIYNNLNPINEFRRKDLGLKICDIDKYIRSKKPYESIEHLFAIAK